MLKLLVTALALAMAGVIYSAANPKPAYYALCVTIACLDADALAPEPRQVRKASA